MKSIPRSLSHLAGSRGLPYGGSTKGFGGYGSRASQFYTSPSPSLPFCCYKWSPEQKVMTIRSSVSRILGSVRGRCLVWHWLVAFVINDCKWCPWKLEEVVNDNGKDGKLFSKEEGKPSRTKKSYSKCHTPRHLSGRILRLDYLGQLLYLFALEVG